MSNKIIVRYVIVIFQLYFWNLNFVLISNFDHRMMYIKIYSIIWVEIIINVLIVVQSSYSGCSFDLWSRSEISKYYFAELYLKKISKNLFIFAFWSLTVFGSTSLLSHWIDLSEMLWHSLQQLNHPAPIWCLKIWDL